jgi:hypothetical protein
MLFNCSRGIVQLPIVFEKRERPWFEKIEKCFPFFIRRKTLSFDKVAFLVWPELNFLWLVFHIVTKHGKIRKVNSRNLFSWKQTCPKIYFFSLK